MNSSFSRKYAPRKSMFRNLTTSLILFEKITTTNAKAKEVKAITEHLLCRAQKNDLASKRYLLSYLFDKNAVKKIQEDLLPRYKDTKSGMIKSYKLGCRKGDGAELTMLELVKGKIIEGENDKPNDSKKATKKDGKGADKTSSGTKVEKNQKNSK